MVQVRNVVAGALALLFGVAGLTTAGCASTSATPAAAAKPPAMAPGGQPSGPSAEPGPTGTLESLALFGDRPTEEAVPSEGSLAASLRQHSFTTEGFDFDPDVYAPDDLLVFASTRNADRPDICLKHATGTAVTQLTSDPADDIQPRFSPDGRLIAFCSNRGGTWDLWLMRRDGTGLVQLTSDPGDEVAPSWSPDGTQLAYTAWGRRTQQWEIWTLSVAQPGAPRFLAYGMFPAWSPDGTRLAFQRARERGSRLFSIWTIELHAGEPSAPTEIARSDLAAYIAPRWSPDGELLVYCAVQEAADGTGHASPRMATLWLVELANGLRFKLTDDAAPAFNPTWAGDGRVFFVSARAGAENIYSLKTDMCSNGAPPAPRLSQARPGDAALE